MIKTLRHPWLAATLAVGMLMMATLAPTIAAAQSSNATSLTITPPFFEINVNPGDIWSSSIRVVDTNPTDLAVRDSVMGFAPSDDEGHGTFVDPTTLTNNADSLTNWIVLGNPSITVPRGGAVDVPFSIVVPKDASPGGHYAAILIGTTPQGGGDEGSHVGVSSYISALIFVSVSGDIQEAGNIQEFSVDKPLYQNPDVNFTIRFTNTGDVHLRPAGYVTIYNAFGKERGSVGVNEGNDLGYVLPSSTRQFVVSWQGDASLLDIGPYTAVVTLAYGSNGEKSVSDTITFWVLPIAKIIELLLIVLAVGAGLFWMVRRFMRRMLQREMMRYGGMPMPPRPTRSHNAHQNDYQANDVDASASKRTVDLRKHHHEE